MLNRYNLRFVIKQTLTIICKSINLPKISFILYINFYLLYHCFVQLGITSKKRLIIEFMALKQSYEE